MERVLLIFPFVHQKWGSQANSRGFRKLHPQLCEVVLISVRCSIGDLFVLIQVLLVIYVLGWVKMLNWDEKF